MDDKILTEEEKKESAKKAAAVALAAAIAAGGTAVADSPIDYENIQLPDPIVMSIDDFGAAAAEEEKLTQSSTRDTISKVLLAPFYAIGAAITWGVDLLTAVAATPIGSALLGWLVTALVILGSLAACLKIAFPDVPLKEMLTKKNLLIVLGGTAFISVGCWAIPQIWPDAGIWVFLFKIAAGIGILLPLFITIRRKLLALKEKLPHSHPKSEMEYLYHE